MSDTDEAWADLRAGRTITEEALAAELGIDLLVRVCQTCGSHVTDALAYHWSPGGYAVVPPEHARVTCVVCYRAACGACAKAWLLGVCGRCP